MKKLIFLGAVLLSFYSYSQRVGVVMVSSDEPMPVDQWFVVCEEGYENSVFYYSLPEDCMEVIDLILDPYELKFKDGELDDDGVLYWRLDNDNGYHSLVFYSLEDNETVVIEVATMLMEDEE